MKSLVTLFLVVVLAGCASTSDYALYAESIARADQARHQADAARYQALAAIAASGSEAAKVAAVMSMTLSGQAQAPGPRIQPPRPMGETLLQWAAILTPALSQAYVVHQNTRATMAASENSTRLGMATTEGFVSIAGKIQAPAAPAANISTVTTVGGNGVIGAGSYSEDRSSVAPVSTTSNAQTTSTTQSLAGGSVLGNGTALSGHGATGASSYLEDRSTTAPVSTDNSNQGNPVTTTTTTAEPAP